MDPKILELESIHVKETLEKLRISKQKVELAMENLGAENLNKLKELRASPETEPHDLYAFMEHLHEQNSAFNFKDKFQRLEEMSSLLKEPYFARTILVDNKNDHTDDIYVGKFGYTEDKPVITDWRAKIASVYYRYRYPQKNVKYDTPGGLEIRDLTLKRTFEIDEGNLIKYYNNDIQLDETEIITDKLKKRTGGVLEDIVETIQESQLDIIEADPREICIVQGCVGSGKSTVAIHKLSHIFFNFPEVVHPERAILIAKNQILVGYLSTLFPKLGIFDIDYKTLRDLVVNIVFREEMKIQIDLDKHTDSNEFGLKDIQNVEAMVLSLHNLYAKEIETLFLDPEFAGFGGFKYNKKFPIQENINEIISDMEEELELQKGYLSENPDSVRSWLFRDNIKSLKKIINQVKKIRTRLNENALPELAKKININTHEKLGYLETLIYLFIYSELIGFSKWKKFEYCVVDEGQDFSTLEYLILGKVVINGRFCILGDLNQSYQDDGISTWDDIAFVIKDAKKAQTFMLDTNYRSTKPIIDLANKILDPYTKNYLPKSINRIGSLVEVKKFATYNDMINIFEIQIKKDIKTLNKSVGIICFSEELLKKADEFLSQEQNVGNIENEHYIKLNQTKRISYIPKGVYLTMFDDCKGLEFAKVYVLDLNLDKISNFKEAKRAFVAVTRAMNELCVYSLL